MDYDKVNVRLSPSYLKVAHAMAEEQGIPYNVMLSRVVHRYLSGLLVDREYPEVGEYELDEEEREILEQLERGDAISVPDVERELEIARQIARNTLNAYETLSLGLSDHNLKIARKMADERGITYQELVAHAVNWYIAGMLVEAEAPIAVASNTRGE